MAYQVNWRVFVPDCEYWETEVLNNLHAQVQMAVRQVILDSLGKGKEVAVTSAEVVYLNK